MRCRTAGLITILLLAFVVLPGFSISSDGSDKQTVGCGKSADPGDWLDGDNVAHLYFHQVDTLFEGKNHGEAWAKMSYTFCGEPSRYVFNGHGLERDAPYDLIAMLAIPEGMMMPQPMPVLLGTAVSNHGGNVHIKGAFPAEEAVWSLALVRAGMWDEVILEGDAPAAWEARCDLDGICDQGILYAELSGENQVPPVTTGASGGAVFYPDSDGDQLAFILKASVTGTVVGAHIHHGAAGTNGPVVATLFSGSDGSGDLLEAGMILESGLLGDFAGSGLSTLLAAMEEGLIYVNVHTLAFPAGEIRGQVRRMDVSGWCRDIYDGCDDDPDGDCHDDCKPTVSPVDPYYERFEGTSYDNGCETDEDCVVGGCSGEVCASEPAITTCEVLPYRPEGGCLCVEGACRWTDCSD